MAIIQRESTVLSILLIVVAVLIPAFLYPNNNEPTSSSSSTSPRATLFDFIPWNWIPNALSLLVVPLQLLSIPIRAILSFTYALIYPAILAIQYALAIVLFPTIFVYRVIGALYPVYVFLATACVIGLVLGLIIRGLVRLLWRVLSLLLIATPSRSEERLERGRKKKRRDVGTRRSMSIKVER